MTISDLLTVLTILLAVYAILPKSRILDIQLRLAWYDWFLILGVSLPVLLYLQFYSTFATLGFSPKLKLSRFNLNPQNVSFLIVLVLSIYLIIKTKIARLPYRKIKKLKELFEYLSYRGEWGQMVELFDKHFDRLNQTYTLKVPSCSVDIYEFSSDAPKLKKISLRTKLYNLNPLLKRNQRLIDGVSDIYHLVQNRHFITALCENNPYIGLKIISSPYFDKYEKARFCNLYLIELFRNPESILYKELDNNQSTSSFLAKYDLPKSNRLLYFLFNDVKHARDLAVWRAIGDSVVLKLIDQHRTAEDTYNLPNDETYFEEKCPVLKAIHFFDIMVSQAIFQNYEDHMSLFYFSYITENICQNINCKDEKGIPNRYAFILNRIIETICDWIRNLEKLPKTQHNLRLEYISLSNQNFNPVHAAILCLGHCTRVIGINEKIPYNFRRHYIVETIWHLYFTLKQNNKINPDYADLLLKSILHGGVGDGNRGIGYVSLIIDGVLHSDPLTYGSELRNATLKELMAYYINQFKYGMKSILLPILRI